MSALEGLVLAGAIATLARGVHLVVLLRSIPRLVDEVPDAPAGPLPSVTIAAAARDEGRHLELAARSWLAQDLPSLQVIAVDDRSSDGSSGILARLAAEDPRLLPLRVDERPAGWLGKCHALSLAASRATGDFILFTDADVKLAPGALARALALAEREDADVLVLMPEVECDGPLQRALTGTFFQFFLTAMGGRGANRDDGRCTIGIGAFNLVRRSAYESVGGHAPLRLQVGDDVALVRLLQRSGFRHRLLSGEGLVSLRWQEGVTGTIRGLEKNFFWGARFSLGLLSLFTLGSLLLLAPLLALLAPSPASLAGLLAWIVAVSVPHAMHSPRRGLVASCLLHPASTLLLVAAGWNSAIRNLRDGAISWRGDRFGLDELRAALLPWRWWREPVAARPARPAPQRSQGVRLTVDPPAGFSRTP